MLMPPSIGYLNRGKTKYIKICKGTEMKYVKMTSTLTTLYATNIQQNHGLFEFSPEHIQHISTKLPVTSVDLVRFQ